MIKTWLLTGHLSKEKLITKINNSKIKCIFTSKDKYNRYIANCFKGKTDFKEKNELQKFIKEEVVDNSILIGKFKLF